MQNKKLIVPVCRGNIARSAVAEELIRREIDRRGLGDLYETVSRGVQGTRIDPEPVMFPNITHYTHGSLYADSRPWLDKHGIDLSKHVSTPIDEGVAGRASVLLAMDSKTKRGLLELFPQQAQKVHLVKELVSEETDIIDPEGVSGTGRQARIFTEIQNTLSEGFPRLLKLAEGKIEIQKEMNKEGQIGYNVKIQERK